MSVCVKLIMHEPSLQVHCKICKRNGGTEDSFVQRFTTGNMFTHHQKSVILDAAGLEGGPRLETENLDRSELQFCIVCASTPFPS